MRLSPRHGLVVAVLIGAACAATLSQEPRGGGPGGAGGRGPGGPGGPGGPIPILLALDADGDGELSPKEIDNAAAALRTLDKNKDGKLTRDEMLPAGREGVQNGPSAAELVTRMMAFDKNGDGKLSRDELPERMQGLLDRADTNKDGVVDKEELTRQAQQQSRRGGGPGGGRGGMLGGEGGRGRGEGPDREPEGRPRS